MSHQHPPVDIEATLAQMQGGPAHDIAPVPVSAEPVPAVGRLGGMVRAALETRPGKAVVGSLTTLMAVAALGACSKAPETTAANPTIGVSSTETPSSSQSSSSASSESSSANSTSPTGVSTSATSSASESETDDSSSTSSESNSPSETTSSSEQSDDKSYGGISLSAFESMVAPKSETAPILKQNPELADKYNNIESILSGCDQYLTKHKLREYLANHKKEQLLEQSTGGELATFPSMANPGETAPSPDVIESGIINFEKGTVGQMTHALEVDPSGELTQRIIDTLYLPPAYRKDQMAQTQANFANNLRSYAAIDAVHVLQVAPRKVDGQDFLYIVSLDHREAGSHTWELTVRTVLDVPVPYDLTTGDPAEPDDLGFPIGYRYFVG